tara:strand:- start:859 stop:1089 length:231 start_codon:yes stop_codon:yes gene_type:complete
MATEEIKAAVTKLSHTLKVNSAGLVPVKFKANYRSYNIGEIAGFSPYKAAGLIYSNIAVEMAEKTKPVKKAIKEKA